MDAYNSYSQQVSFVFACQTTRQLVSRVTESSQEGSHQLEEECKAHDQGVGGQEVLPASDHEGPHCQVLPCWCSLGHLDATYLPKSSPQIVLT